MSAPPGPAPWHREPWVWLMLAIPFSAVVMGVVLVTFAIRSDDGLVDDDYYRRGMEINRVLKRDERAARLRLRARVDLGPDAIAVLIESGAGPGAGPGGGAPAAIEEALVLRFAHPTRAGLDHEIALTPLGAGRYLGPGTTLAAGRWHVRIESAGWRLSGRLSAGQSRGTVDLTPRGL